MHCHDKDQRIFTLYLSSQNQPFDYRGYSSLSQIGQYYSVTVNDRKTRLYTAVNFLHKSNIKLMAKMYPNAFPSAMDESKHDNNKSMQEMNTENGSAGYIPLLIKRYEDGEFTADFLQTNFQGSVIVSRPRGRGLSLQDMPEGRIVLLAGGTGLYPFSDTIDLLFKEHLVNTGHSQASAIKEADPLVGKKPFSKFKFSLYIAVNDLEELHPITLMQCDELARTGKLKCFAKMKTAEKKKLQANYSSITMIDSRFEKVVEREIKEGGVSQFCICGPTRFSKFLVETLHAA